MPLADVTEVHTPAAAAGAQRCAKDQQDAVTAQLAVGSELAKKSAAVRMSALLHACRCCFPKPRCALALFPGSFLIHSCVAQNFDGISKN